MTEVNIPFDNGLLVPPGFINPVTPGYFPWPITSGAGTNIIDPTNAAVIYVATNGNDAISNVGGPTNPFLTIAAAINYRSTIPATTPVTIMVGPGVGSYRQHLGSWRCCYQYRKQFCQCKLSYSHHSAYHSDQQPYWRFYLWYIQSGTDRCCGQFRYCAL